MPSVRHAVYRSKLMFPAKARAFLEYLGHFSVLHGHFSGTFWGASGTFWGVPRALFWEGPDYFFGGRVPKSFRNSPKHVCIVFLFLSSMGQRAISVSAKSASQILPGLAAILESTQCRIVLGGIDLSFSATAGAVTVSPGAVSDSGVDGAGGIADVLTSDVGVTVFGTAVFVSDAGVAALGVDMISIRMGDGSVAETGAGQSESAFDQSGTVNEYASHE
jgi:hypothetical protein